MSNPKRDWRQLNQQNTDEPECAPYEHEWVCVTHPERVYVITCKDCWRIRYTEEEEWQITGEMIG